MEAWRVSSGRSRGPEALGQASGRVVGRLAALALWSLANEGRRGSGSTQLGNIDREATLDEVLHRALGLTSHDWQSLYHFTIGGPVEDLSLRTVPPYRHLAADTP